MVYSVRYCRQLAKKVERKNETFLVACVTKMCDIADWCNLSSFTCSLTKLIWVFQQFSPMLKKTGSRKDSLCEGVASERANQHWLFAKRTPSGLPCWHSSLARYANVVAYAA